MTPKLDVICCLPNRREMWAPETGSGLDPKACALSETALESVRSSGWTMLLTSHSLADGDEICDDKAVIASVRRNTHSPEATAQCK